MTTWRDRARPIIAEALRKTEGQPEVVRDKALRDAYPFGERKHFPYKVWLDEISRQRYGRRSNTLRSHTKPDLLAEREKAGQEVLF